jgi:FtsP/CotA-like multicopper oxidase with cupredoxin domain
MSHDEHKERPAMRSMALRKTKALLALVAMAAVYSVAPTAPASAAPVTIDLCAKAGTIALPGDPSVDVWSFVSACGDIAQIPGPVLQVNAGDVVTVNVAVDSSLTGHDVTFELPGLPVTTTATPGQYQFTASREGTFTYQSPGDAGRQMAMGLYGALVVQPSGSPTGVRQPCVATAGTAYGNAFDRECVLVLSALDPDFNASPDGDLHAYLATYWLINGEAFPDTDAITGAAGQSILLRYVNAGFDNTTMMLVGLHEQVLARDAYPVPNALSADAETVPAGATEDAIVAVPGSSSSGLPNGFPLLNRQLHLTNGAPGAVPGGQMTFIVP